jgi:hypothetical protein
VLLLHENTLIKGLMGSELGAIFYRALGARIGKNTCILGPLYWCAPSPPGRLACLPSPTKRGALTRPQSRAAGSPAPADRRSAALSHLSPHPHRSQEPDCVTVGDYTVVEDGSFFMAHTVENRVLKFTGARAIL